MLLDDLNQWLTETGGAMVDKHAAGQTLTPMEQVVYEIWLLDTQVRNGGLSQYFCNCGSEQWRSCTAAASAVGLTSFGPFSEQVSLLIAGARDPYKALIKKGRAGDEVYDTYSNDIVRELRDRFPTVV